MVIESIMIHNFIGCTFLFYTFSRVGIYLLQLLYILKTPDQHLTIDTSKQTILLLFFFRSRESKLTGSFDTNYYTL